jgi:hypothetical protein
MIVKAHEVISSINLLVYQNKLIPAEREEFFEIFDIVVKSNQTVRKTKPKLTGAISRKAAYVWRMVVFQLSSNRQHQCMPVCADFDLPANDENGKWSSRIAREQAKKLDLLVYAIVESVPTEQRHGINRWARALGCCLK